MTQEKDIYQLLFQIDVWSPQLRMNLHMTLLFLAIAVCMFFFILFSRYRDGFRFTRKRWMIKKSQQYITSYMFNEEIGQASADKFRQKHLINHTRRQIFTHALLELHKNIVGEFSDRLRQLYLHTGLHVHSKQKLYAGSWNVIADGINELAEMDMQQDTNLIRGFINHHNPILRSAAQVAYLRLQRNTPFSFLDELQEPLTEWQQMQLASAAHKAHINMPSFKRWLSKSELSIVIFSVRMIVLHNQHNAASELIELLRHPNKTVRAEVTKAIRQLEIYEAKDMLLELYDQEKIDLKLEIIKALASIGDEDLLPFYKKVMESPERRLQLAAAKAIGRSGITGQELLQCIKNDGDHALQPVAANALDERI